VTIIGIDPGSEETAYAVMSEDYAVVEADKQDNNRFLDFTLPALIKSGIGTVVIEGIQSYGMAVGKTVFETCYIVGECRRIAAIEEVNCYIYPRPEYARALIGGMKVKDSLIRQALLTRFGSDKKGGPLHKLKGNSDKRSAYAVAVYHADKMCVEAA
jgi:hypothetical protein